MSVFSVLVSCVSVSQMHEMRNTLRAASVLAVSFVSVREEEEVARNKRQGIHRA